MEEIEEIQARILAKLQLREESTPVSEPLSKSDLLGLYERIRDNFVIGDVIAERPEVMLLEKLIFCGVPKKYLFADKLPASLKIQTDGFDVGKGYYIWGGVGTGKTYFICALVRSYLLKLQEKRRLHLTLRLPKIAGVPEILMSIKDSYKDGSTISEQEIIRRCSDYPCLILDDLGVEKPSEWVMQTLYAIIDNRYKDDKQTLFTSNLSLDRIQERIGDRIPSRIAEMCDIVQIKGSDRRLAGVKG